MRVATILLSIKPEHVEKIFSGTKRFEYRRSGCKEKVEKIVIYSTAPVMKVVGEVDVEEVLVGSFEEIWERTKEFSGTTYESLMEYYKGRDKVIAYGLKNVKRYEVLRNLPEFGVKVAPQSFVYLEKSH